MPSSAGCSSILRLWAGPAILCRPAPYEEAAAAARFSPSSPASASTTPETVRSRLVLAGVAKLCIATTEMRGAGSSRPCCARGCGKDGSAISVMDAAFAGASGSEDVSTPADRSGPASVFACRPAVPAVSESVFATPKAADSAALADDGKIMLAGPCWIPCPSGNEASSCSPVEAAAVGGRFNGDGVPSSKSGCMAMRCGCASPSIRFTPPSSSLIRAIMLPG